MQGYQNERTWAGPLHFQRNLHPQSNYSRTMTIVHTIPDKLLRYGLGRRLYVSSLAYFPDIFSLLTQDPDHPAASCSPHVRQESPATRRHSDFTPRGRDEVYHVAAPQRSTILAFFEHMSLWYVCPQFRLH